MEATQKEQRDLVEALMRSKSDAVSILLTTGSAILPDLMAPANSDFEFLSHSLVNPTDKCSAWMCACCDPENDTVNLRMTLCSLIFEPDDAPRFIVFANTSTEQQDIVEICTATCQPLVTAR